ncbi:hypothetical protein YC2023_045105 [Brassica napus]
MRLHNQTRGGPLISWCSMEKLKMKKNRVQGIRVSKRRDRQIGESKSESEKIRCTISLYIENDVPAIPSLNVIKVHATCRNNNLKSLGDQCIVGECKTIENFQVSELGKELRPKEELIITW